MLKGLGRVLEIAGERPILLDGEGRAFCAGGDIKAQVAAIKAKDKAMPSAYFRDEYGFNARLFSYKSSLYVSYLNGIVMGGGYGVSAHGSHLVTCEATQFAMPEVKIGFFPDVGAVWHLARVKNQLGTYMALTGNTVGAADMLHMGLAHAHVPLTRAAKLKPLIETEGVEGALAALHAAPDDMPILQQHEEVVARCFAHDEAEAIVAALKTDGSAFALETAGQIEQRSPMSVKVALAHLRRAAHEPFDAVIARDLRLALAFLDNPDFTEGVRAAVIDKDRNPRWNPHGLALVDDATVALYLGGTGS